MADITPPDLESDVGKVRVLIQDMADPYDFSDDEITVFISLGGGNLFRASASAMYAIAAHEALTYKYVKTDDLLVDGTKAADVLLKRAKAFLDQANEQDLIDADEAFVLVSRDLFPWVPEATPRPWL